MNKPREEYALEEDFFINAVRHEVFNRVFPSIRHDLVGGISASLMRVSIMERHLNKAEVPFDSLRQDLKKIELQLKDNINSIRDLQYWDFDSPHEDMPINLINKSVQLMASQLALKFIQITIQPEEARDTEQLKTKPLLYCLLCLWSFIEDNNFDNHQLEVRHIGKSIQITFEAKLAQDTVLEKNRNLIFSEAIVTRFVQHHLMGIQFGKEKISLTWA